MSERLGCMVRLSFAGAKLTRPQFLLRKDSARRINANSAHDCAEADEK